MRCFSSFVGFINSKMGTCFLFQSYLTVPVWGMGKISVPLGECFGKLQPGGQRLEETHPGKHLFSKSSSVPCSLPLCFYSYKRGWIWLSLSRGQCRHAISHWNSKLAEREGVKCAKKMVQSGRNPTFSRRMRNF